MEQTQTSEGTPALIELMPLNSEEVIDKEITTTVTVSSEQIGKLRDEIPRMAGIVANGFPIENTEQFEECGALVKSIKTTLNDAEASRKVITKPLDNSKASTMVFFKALTSHHSGALTILRESWSAYKKKADAAAREEQRKRDEAAERERKRLAEQAEAAEEAGRGARAATLEDRASMVQAPVVESAAPVGPVSTGGLKTRKVWRFRIKDATKVPDQFKMIDDKKIGKLVTALHKDAEDTVPGIEVYYDETPY